MVDEPQAESIVSIKANAPEGKWHIGRYAAYIFYASVITFFALGFVLGLLFHPIIYR